ncbi:MAG: hypothetical protein II973_05730 [Spirochaetaceae bacterium]|nr:hypothetical protein [Spirochaetaceae bacterium]
MNYSISVALQIWHPVLSADQLQALFNKSPDIKYSGGEKLFAKRNESYICYDVVPMQDFDDLYESIKKANAVVLGMLKEKTSLFELKQTGGRICFYCAIYTKEHIVFTVPSEILREVSGLGIDIGVEVFQNYID